MICSANFNVSPKIYLTMGSFAFIAMGTLSWVFSEAASEFHYVHNNVGERIHHIFLYCLADYM
jgi:hypothetical protein